MVLMEATWWFGRLPVAIGEKEEVGEERGCGAWEMSPVLCPYPTAQRHSPHNLSLPFPLQPLSLLFLLGWGPGTSQSAEIPKPSSVPPSFSSILPSPSQMPVTPGVQACGAPKPYPGLMLTRGWRKQSPFLFLSVLATPHSGPAPSIILSWHLY